MKNKTVLITGGLGFIGSHAISKWIKKGWKVVVFDNLSSNVIDIDNKLLKNVELVIGDVSKIKYTKKIDLIIHLASPIGTVSLLDHPGKIAKIIIDDLYSVISLSKDNKCPLIFASTCEVYGSKKNIFVTENDEKVVSSKYEVRSEYSVAKMLCEVILSNIAKSDTSFKYQIIRPFNVAGPNQKWSGGHVIPRFVKQAKSNEDITVYGNGMQIRSFTYVEDVINAIYLISKAPNRLYNNTWDVGNIQNAITIDELAHLIKDISNSNSKIVYVDPKNLHGKLFSEVNTKISQSNKLTKFFGWKSTKDLKSILKEIIYEK
jgi:UDP-glucose 4-epimerase